MKPTSLLPLLALLSRAASAAPPLVAQQEPALLVSTAWLSDHLQDPELVLLHVGNEGSYAEAHIPGARLLPLGAFTTERDGLSTEMPALEALDEALESAGVTNASRIVVYSATHPPQLAARLYVTLDQAGLGERSSLLDGGLRAWRAEQRPVTTAAATTSRSALELLPRSDLVVETAYVQGQLGSSQVAIVDARDPRFWTGAERNQQRATRAGRIPGAKNVPFSSLVDDSGRRLEPEALAALFQDAGIAPGQPVVAYCHVGQQASLLFVAARRLGHDVKLYDGSYEDWSRRLELSVETSPPPPQLR